MNCLCGNVFYIWEAQKACNMCECFFASSHSSFFPRISSVVRCHSQRRAFQTRTKRDNTCEKIYKYAGVQQPRLRTCCYKCPAGRTVPMPRQYKPPPSNLCSNTDFHCSSVRPSTLCVSLPPPHPKSLLPPSGSPGVQLPSALSLPRFSSLHTLKCNCSRWVCLERIGTFSAVVKDMDSAVCGARILLRKWFLTDWAAPAR